MKSRAPIKINLITISLTALLIFPTLGVAKSNRKDWFCKVSAFTRTYHAVGHSKAEAKLAVIDKCRAENNAMFCDKVECEGPEVNYINDVMSYDSNRGWICKLTPFTETYMASANTRARAELKVMKKCARKNSQMFCENPECREG